LWIGTKLLKWQAWIREFHSLNGESLALVGSFHSNYVAAFSTLLRLSGYRFSTFVHSRDKDLQSPRSKIVEEMSPELHWFPHFEAAFRQAREATLGTKTLILPQFGLSSPVLRSLFPLWEELSEKTSWQDSCLVLEIGSGASFFSLLDFLQEKPAPKKILGLLIGESLFRWESHWRKSYRNLSGREIPALHLVFSEPPKSFGKWGKYSSSHVSYVEREKMHLPFPLDLEYSGKTLRVLRPVQEKTIYLCQGGL